MAQVAFDGCADAHVGDVLKKMVDEGIGCVMVVDRDKLVGIFSERDALMKLNADAPKFLARPISQFMTAGPRNARNERQDRVRAAQDECRRLPAYADSVSRQTGRRDFHPRYSAVSDRADCGGSKKVGLFTGSPLI